jgi:3-oxoacyl-[acyl-carrier protein] reductase
MFALTDRVAVITGAASGIGAATARRFAAAGARLMLADYAPDGHDMSAVVSTIKEAGGEVVVLPADVRSTPDVTALVTAAVSHFGGLDIVVANAAIARIKPLGEMTDADWNDTLDTNLTGVMRLFRAAVPAMRAGGGGRLLATTSTAGNHEAWPAHAHYAAAKAGIVGMVRALAAEVGPDGITVNTIAPGIIETPQTLDGVNSLGLAGVAATADHQPIRRVGLPDDIAAGFHYLASAEASFVTGHLLVVDGGRILHHG